MTHISDDSPERYWLGRMKDEAEMFSRGANPKTTQRPYSSLRTDLDQISYHEVEVPRRVKKISCPRCVELWDEYDAATRNYSDLLKQQAEIATTNVNRSYLLDPQIETAFQRRSAARAAVEFHRVLDHGKEERAMTAGQPGES
jgi:hypothetical protein